MLRICYKIILSSFILLLFIPFFVSAQVVPELENNLVLRISPTHPGPNEEVTISVESFSIDLNDSTISWFVNGILEQQSIGVTSFKFVTKGLGSSANIDIIAETENSSLVAEQVTIRPTDADIIWQGNTSAHPFYKGKSIPSVGSTINVEVVPYFINESGSRLNANELTYSWRIDGKSLPKASGRGKNTIVISQIKPVGSILAEVEIESPDQVFFRRERLSIPIQDSELLVYENDPLLGILFNKTINDLFSLTGQETKLIAYPFFMSFLNRNDSHIDYSWRLDRKPITLGEDKGSIIVSHSGEEEGEAQIDVSVQNSRDIFQRNEARFTIEFGKNKSPGFGF